MVTAKDAAAFTVAGVFAFLVLDNRFQRYKVKQLRKGINVAFEGLDIAQAMTDAMFAGDQVEYERLNTQLEFLMITAKGY